MDSPLVEIFLCGHHFYLLTQLRGDWTFFLVEVVLPHMTISSLLPGPALEPG